MTSERQLTAPEHNARRIANSLVFHRERLEWLSEEQPLWGDEIPVTKSDIRLYTRMSQDAIQLLERGCFVAGGDA